MIEIIGFFFVNEFTASADNHPVFQSGLKPYTINSSNDFLNAIIIFFSIQDFINFCIGVRLILKLRNSFVGENNFGRDFRFKDNSFQSSATRQRHINLSGSETFSRVNN